MTEMPIGGHAVANELFELLQLREPALLLARPHKNPVNPHIEDASGAGNERKLTDLVLERGEEFLGRPAGSHEPAATGAVVDLDAILHLQSDRSAMDRV
jgi:hypothetical protein